MNKVGKKNTVFLVSIIKEMSTEFKITTKRRHLHVITVRSGLLNAQLDTPYLQSVSSLNLIIRNIPYQWLESG